MRVCEGQSLGALAVLIASMFICYGDTYFHNYQLCQQLSLPWGDQNSGMLAVEITDHRGVDGVYFFPQGTKLAELIESTGIIDKGERSGHGKRIFIDGFSISVSSKRNILNIKEMDAIRRLSLGLKIDVNRASVVELCSVPGIGVKMAERIVHARQMRGRFDSLSDLETVPGIKKKKLSGFKKYIVIRSLP
jgi:competence protein ComEA